MKATAIDSKLATLDTLLSAVRSQTASKVAGHIDRLAADLAAARFHLRGPARRPTLVAILGGTGTGKSTLVNRLLDATVSASSFRRTFTAGAVAICAAPSKLPAGWLGVEHVIIGPDQLPAKGRLDTLSVVEAANDLLDQIVLIDTPDLDGDQPAHHIQADRAFRWADAVVLLVTPEKYQMPELTPYYRLANRYGLPSLLVMNKVEDAAAVEDFAVQRGIGASPQSPEASEPNKSIVFAIARDDSAYQPPASSSLNALRIAIAELPALERGKGRGLRNRVADLLGRLQDQIVVPLQNDRREVDRLTVSLRAIEAPSLDVDASPLLQQLRRRLQERSILYLMGPGKMLDRVRQVPSLLARLPRHAWDLLSKGETSSGANPPPPDMTEGKLGFRPALVDQFKVLQSRIEDIIRSSEAAGTRIMEDPASFEASRLPSELAGAIADEELAELKRWLEARWNAEPRDTAVVKKLVKFVPGASKLARWSEAAPYVLAAIVAAHHAFFGHVDLMILGGYTLVTWLTERISNEVASRARRTNESIADRFAKLSHEQINRTILWLETMAPKKRSIDELAKLADSIGEHLDG